MKIGVLQQQLFASYHGQSYWPSAAMRTLIQKYFGQDMTSTICNITIYQTALLVSELLCCSCNEIPANLEPFSR